MTYFSEDDDSSMDNVRQCTLSIEGMTCGSCVKNIQDTVGKKPGVLKVKVSLEASRGIFDYDPKVTAPDLIKDYVDEMGFEASFGSSNALVLSDCEIWIDGMTCQSCVKNIESAVADMSGINDIKVFLEQKKAVASYDKGLVTASQIAAKIEDMGFEAKVMDSVQLNVEGMTCNSCVKNIEETIWEKIGILSIKVSLNEKLARVEYFVQDLTAEDVRQAIEDMGFEATIKTKRDSVPKKYLRADKATERRITIQEDILEDLDDGDFEKCFLRIEGMTCASCVAAIEKHAKKLSGTFLKFKAAIL